MSELICPYEVYLHDEQLSLTEVFTEVISHPYENLKALLESPLHQCDKCCSDASLKSKFSSVLGGLRQLATSRKLSGQSLACAGAVAACAWARNGLPDAVLYFLATLSISRIVPKLAAGFKLFMNYLHLKNSATTSTTFLRRQFVRCVLSLLILTACGGAALGVKKLVGLRSGMQAYSSNAVSDSGFLGATMLLAMLGIRSLGRHFPAFLQLVNTIDLRDALRDSVARFIAGVLELIKKTVQFFTKSEWAKLDWCIAQCREKYQSMSQREFEKGVDFSERLLNAKGSALGFIGSEELAANIDKALDELAEFDTKTMSLAQHANIAHRQHQLLALKNESEWVATMSKERVPPVGVMFLGPPGVGKSYCVPLFLEAVYREMVRQGLQRDVHRGVYFTRNSDTEFYDGYTGQPFVYYSDMFRGTLSNDVKARESLARELSELQSLVDTAPYYPPFAFEPSPRKYGKGVAIAPSLVLLTSNYHCVDTLGDSYILARRFPHVYMFLQKKSRKDADLSHLAVYRKKTPFMENGPDTGGSPFSGDYTPSAQFPVWENELSQWPWANDWEPVDFKTMVEETVASYKAQCGIFSNQRVVNPFLSADVTVEEHVGSKLSSDENETGIPLPDGVADPRAFWDMLGDSHEYEADAGVAVKLLQNGYSLRRDDPVVGRRLYRWDGSVRRYLRVRALEYDLVDIRSTGNDCLFAALQAGGIMRDLTTAAMRARCADYAGPASAAFKPGEMISSDDMDTVSAALHVNIQLSISDDVVVPMNPPNPEWPTVHIRHSPDHFKAAFPKGTYDGWCPPQGGTINGKELIRGGAWSISDPRNLRQLLNMRRKVLCRLHRSFLPGLRRSGQDLWFIDMASPELEAPSPDPWVVIQDADVLLVIAPRRFEDRFLIDYCLVHEALANVSNPKLARRDHVVRAEDHLILQQVDMDVFEDMAKVMRLSPQSLMSVFGLMVRPAASSKFHFMVPFEPQWWLVHGMVDGEESQLCREQIAAWVATLDRATSEPVLSTRTRRVIEAFRNFWKRNKMPIQVALAAVGLYSVYRAARPDKFCPRSHYVPDGYEESKIMESLSGNYLLYAKDTLEPPSKSLLDKLFSVFKKKPDVKRGGGAVAAHIEDLPDFKVRCPDLIAEPVEEVDLSQAPFGFKASLYRPSNFPRVSLMRDDKEEMAVTGIHLRGGLVMFPAHLVDAATEGNMLEVHGVRYHPIKSTVRYPLGRHLDVALLLGGHAANYLAQDGFAPSGFVDRNLAPRELVEVFRFDNGKPVKQIARIADVNVTQRKVKHGARENMLAGYLVLGADVRPGDCGALLIAKGRIIGMLIAGCEEGSLWVPLTVDAVQKMIAKYGDKDQPVSGAFAALASGHGAADRGNTPRISNFHAFKQSEKFDKPYDPIRTTIADTIDPKGYWQPAPVTKESYMKAVARFPAVRFGTLPQSLLDAADYYSALDPNRYCALPTWKAAANGCTDDGCKRIVLKKVELKTSPGKPFTEPHSNVAPLLPAHLCGLKDKTALYRNDNGMLYPCEELERMADKVYEGFRKGYVSRSPFTMALKREIRDGERCREGKCRLFIMPPHHVNLAIRRVLGDWAGRYKREGYRLGHAIGINVHSQVEWRNLCEFLRRDGFKVIAPDFSAFDTSHPIALNQLIAKKVADHYPEDERPAVRAAFLACNVMEFYDGGSFIVRSGQASGSQITTQINCWFSQLLIRGALYDIFAYKGWEREDFVNKNFRIVCYGDDVLLAASPAMVRDDDGKDLVAKIKAYVARLGYKLTNGDKGELVAFEMPTQVRFLKRLFFPSHDTMKAPLPSDELGKMLTWYDGEPEDFCDYQRGVLRSFLMELAEQDEDDANKWLQTLKGAVARDPAWQRAFEQIGGVDFYQRARIWKRSESDALLKDDMREVVLPPGWSDSFGRSAWFSIGI